MRRSVLPAHVTIAIFADSVVTPTGGLGMFAWGGGPFPKTGRTFRRTLCRFSTLPSSLSDVPVSSIRCPETFAAFSLTVARTETFAPEDSSWVART